MSAPHCVRKEVRLTLREAQLLEEHAALAEVTESDYIRTLITDPRHVFTTDANTLRAAYRELKRQGTNINQIAYAVNAGRAKSIDKDGLAGIAEEVRSATELLAKALEGKRR